MKILYITTISKTMVFFPKLIENLIQKGHTVDIATNISQAPVCDCYYEWGCKVYPISCSRSPLSGGNIKAIRQIKKIVEENNYDIVHCHTPIAALCTRLACIKARKKGTKVFYTAHGFHFYKGAPLKNWAIYYTIEKLCGRLTDVLITINKEDYGLAKKKIKAKKVAYVPGVGIDVDKFKDTSIDKSEKKAELNISEDKMVLLSVGELNVNKNHETVIRAIKDIDNVHYLIAGEGDLHQRLDDVIKELNLSDRVNLLGFRNDILELCAMTDIFVFPSIREGLPVSVMEAMASGLPCIVTRIRGNTDLVDENGGAFFEACDIADCKRAIEEILNGDTKAMGEYNMGKVTLFGDKAVIQQVEQLYAENI
ncbi:MAG: glycosyltransferase family 4 protein [Clostridia bacterium]|nr:glycosyltransferase family 4 protein [Clostridia bacterium]